MEIATFNRQITERGWAIFSDVVSPNLIERMRIDMDKCYARCRTIQLANGLDATENTVHHLIGQEQSFMDCLNEYEKLDPYLECYFEGKYILNSFGGNMLSKGFSYANNIHRELRSFSGSLPLMLNTLLFLDDFTYDNGATWLMHRGHIQSDKPDEDDFMKQAFQVTGRSGSVAVWNSNLWHRAGVNSTANPRRSVTPEFTKPFMKQGFDYTQFVTEETSSWLKQALGWNSRTPATLEQWYQTADNRYYKGNQG